MAQVEVRAHCCQLWQARSCDPWEPGQEAGSSALPAVAGWGQGRAWQHTMHARVPEGLRSRCSACPCHPVTVWAMSAVQEQSRQEQAAQQAAQAARQQADQAGAAVQSRDRSLQDQQVLLQDTQRECGEHKRAADQAAEELSQEQHRRQRVQEDLVVS